MEKTNCWALDYEPTFKNLHFNKSLKNKLKHLTQDNILHMNIYINGINGSGKNTIIKLILNECFNLKLNQFEINEELEDSLIFENIFIADFLNLHQNRAKNIRLHTQIC